MTDLANENGTAADQLCDPRGQASQAANIKQPHIGAMQAAPNMALTANYCPDCSCERCRRLTLVHEVDRLALALAAERDEHRRTKAEVERMREAMLSKARW